MEFIGESTLHINPSCFTALFDTLFHLFSLWHSSVANHDQSTREADAPLRRNMPCMMPPLSTQIDKSRARYMKDSHLRHGGNCNSGHHTVLSSK